MWKWRPNDTGNVRYLKGIRKDFPARKTLNCGKKPHSNFSKMKCNADLSAW